MVMGDIVNAKRVGIEVGVDIITLEQLYQGGSAQDVGVHVVHLLLLVVGRADLDDGTTMGRSGGSWCT